MKLFKRTVYLTPAQARSIERHDSRVLIKSGQVSYGRWKQHGNDRFGYDKKHDPYGKGGRYHTYKK